MELTFAQWLLYLQMSEQNKIDFLIKNCYLTPIM